MNFSERKLGLEKILVGAGINSQNKINEALDSAKGSYVTLIGKLRTIPPRTIIWYHETATDLFFCEETISTEKELLITNTKLVDNLAQSSDDRQPRARNLVEIVERVCDKLDIGRDNKSKITIAANIHDLSRAHYEADGRDRSRYARKQTDVITQLNFSHVVIDILKAMYIDLSTRQTRPIPVDLLGGNILTAVDLLLDNYRDVNNIVPDDLEVLSRLTRRMTGRLFYGEVAEALLAALSDEGESEDESQSSGRVLLLAAKSNVYRPLELRLKNEGLKVATVKSLGQLSAATAKGLPEALLIVSDETTSSITKMVKYLAANGIDINDVPTFVVVRDELIPQLTALLDQGVQDIVGLGGGFDQLVIKLERSMEMVRERTSRSGLVTSKGTTGHLSDMSLVDILQALGPGRKTAKITVSETDDDSRQLVLFLDKGEICFASLGDLGCPDAIYQALKWTDGHWRIEPISSDDLPSPNNDLPNDAILMEGCRLMDESSRVSTG